MTTRLDDIIQNIKNLAKRGEFNNLKRIKNALSTLQPYTHAENRNDKLLEQCCGTDGYFKPELFEVIEVIILDKLLEVVSQIETGGIDLALELLKKYRVVYSPRQGWEYFFYPPENIDHVSFESSFGKNVWGSITTNTDSRHPAKIRKLNEFITQLEKGELPKKETDTPTTENPKTGPKKTENALPTETETTHELSGLGSYKDRGGEGGPKNSQSSPFGSWDNFGAGLSNCVRNDGKKSQELEETNSQKVSVVDASNKKLGIRKRLRKPTNKKILQPKPFNKPPTDDEVRKARNEALISLTERLNKSLEKNPETKTEPEKKKTGEIKRPGDIIVDTPEASKKFSEAFIEGEFDRLTKTIEKALNSAEKEEVEEALAETKEFISKSNADNREFYSKCKEEMDGRKQELEKHLTKIISINQSIKFRWKATVSILLIILAIVVIVIIRKRKNKKS